jgi:hypothetical protein
MSTRGLAGAVVPQAPPEYDQAYMTRLVDVMNKIIEQLVKPQQVTGATLVLTSLPQETPRTGVEGEVYTKVCNACGATVLAIEQTQPEHLTRRRSDASRNRRSVAKGETSLDIGNADRGAAGTTPPWDEEPDGG